jgi:hypothetical protein
VHGYLFDAVRGAQGADLSVDLGPGRRFLCSTLSQPVRTAGLRRLVQQIRRLPPGEVW